MSKISDTRSEGMPDRTLEDMSDSMSEYFCATQGVETVALQDCGQYLGGNEWKVPHRKYGLSQAFCSTRIIA